MKIMKYVVTVFYVPVMVIYRLILSMQKPKEKQVLFFSFPDFSDNARALYEYMLKEPKYDDHEFVWLVKDPSVIKSDLQRTKFYRLGSDWHFGISLGALKAISQSKLIFYTHTSPLHYVNEKSRQLVINLWHGCGYKARKTPIPKKKQFDYGLVPGPAFIKVKAEFWGCKEEQVLPIGYPRYDAILHPSERAVSFKQELMEGCKKLVLWMPTYRKTERGEFAVSKITGYYEIPGIQSDEEMLRLDQFCKERSIMLCIKRHPKQVRYECEKQSFQNIRFLSHQDLEDRSVGLYEFLACVDALITDYSSSAIDYLLTDRPMAFTLNDMKDYGKAQGFVFENPLDYMPGAYIYALCDLEKFIEDINLGADPNARRRKEVLNQVQNLCEDYCGRICEYLKI